MSREGKESQQLLLTAVPASTRVLSLWKPARSNPYCKYDVGETENRDLRDLRKLR